MPNKYFLFDVGYVDKRHDPEPGGGNIGETREGQGDPVVAGCDAAHLLEVVGHPFDAVTVPVALRPLRDGMIGRISCVSRFWRKL